MTPDILSFNENINIKSTGEDIRNFLKTEIKLEENILEKFRNINLKEFKELKENDLINLGLKLGERRKLLFYLLSIQNIIDNNKNNDNKDLSNTSTTEEICLFLKNKFGLNEEILNQFRESDISGEEYLNFDMSDFLEFEINDNNKQKQILDYINKIKQNESNNNQQNESTIGSDGEDKINEEENYNHFKLIDIDEYITSENDISKCLLTKKEGFIELCKFMDIETKDNCSILAFDQANKYKLKISTLWGSIDGLFEFFEKRKMKNIIEFFKNNKDDKGGIYLLIKEDKSFGYILIWPGKMSYLYRKMDEPQKSLLLSLIRTGFSLSDNNIICFSEKQKSEFDFQAINRFNSENIFRAIEGNVELDENPNAYFKLDKDLEIKFDSNEIDGKLKNIKINGSSIFFYILTKETENCQSYDNIPKDKLNFNAEFITLDSKFNLNYSKLYDFLKQFDCLKNLIKDDEKFMELYKKKNESIKQKYIDNLSNFISKISQKKFKCEICQKIKKDSLYFFLCKNHAFHLSHKSCINNDNDNDNDKEINESFKESQIKEILTLKKENTLLSKLDKKKIIMFEFFCQQFLNKDTEEYLNPVKNSIIEELTKINNQKDYFKNDINNMNSFLENLKVLVNRINEEIWEKDEEIKKCYLEWKNDLMIKLSESYKSKYENITSYIKYENCIYDEKDNKLYFTYKKYTKNISKEIIKLFNFYKYDNEKYYLLKSENSKKWNADEFENYFDKEKVNGILIKKSDNNYILSLNNKSVRFNGLYDYYNNIVIITNRKGTDKDEYINIYYLDEQNRFLYNKGLKKIFDYIGNITKIKIVPYLFEDFNIYAIFFTKNLISLINISEDIYTAKLTINEYKDYELNLLQFLVYEKFLLVFFFNEQNKNNFWDFDIYEISPKNRNFIKIPKDKNYLDSNFTSKNGKFSICKIKNIPILYFCYIENDKFNLKLKEIKCSSSLTIKSNCEDYISDELNLTEGNCIFNYFYHAFIKYPSIGALQYNYFNKEKPKKIFIYSNNLTRDNNFKDYFNELKRLIINERGLNFDDINYSFEGIFKSKKISDNISLDDLIIKFIQVIPLQIAKIKNYFFKAMSNGKEIIKEDLYENYSKDRKTNQIQISIEDYADNINFGMNNSIFNYYDIPVVVLSFMGSQSIGKSTLSNELVQSFFNVNEMRCTEGIWMAVSLFRGNWASEKCKDKCKKCRETNCRLFIHNKDIECICDNCCCNENCCLFIGKANIKENQNCCKKRCALPKNHKDERHICEVSPYNHGFICVSLDFEGLGSFERSLEQDIDLSMVGAAISNSIILRADKTFDMYMESRMLDWSEGSRKIKNTNNKKFFGGTIIFCQKDIPRHCTREVIEEFEIGIKDSIKNWYQKEKVKNFKDLNLNQNPVFGIFSKYINLPTPIFNKNEFHITLRKELIHLLIRNNLITKSYPNYRTGTEFMFFLKSILAIVDMHDYNVLDSIAIDNLKNYLFDNKIKAIEIFGIYSNNLEGKDFKNIEQLEKYLNSNLELLKSSYISSSKLEIEEILVINNITSANLKSRKIENIKFKNFMININIIANESKEESKGETNSYKLIIEGIKEIGLLLLIPSEYKEKFETEDIRKNLFLLWKEICNKINLSTFEIIHNFELFINSIIERRDNNIKKWLENLTSSFSEIDTKSIKELKSPLKERWKLCSESCSYCYYKCVKMSGHIKEHNCGFNHICNEKCQICEIIKCNDSNNCVHICKNSVTSSLCQVIFSSKI